MIAYRAPSRRGAALLIALATLLLTVTATAMLARAAATASAQRKIEHATRLADDLLAATEQPIRAWLEKEAPSIVLPPDVAEPAVSVLHDCFAVDGFEGAIAITAWDQCGMAPLALLRSGSPLRSVLSGGILKRVDQVDVPPGVVPGLDLFSEPSQQGFDQPSLFPCTLAVPITIFGEHGTETWNRTRPNVAEDNVALGACIATHNDAPGTVNVNTAPIALLESAVRLAGRSGIEQIIAAREQGKPAAIVAAHRNRSSIAPNLVARSGAWSFRIDIRIGWLRRSWWAVYTGSGRTWYTATPRSPSSWECVQRLAITE
jgi:hypothetical protein